MKTLTSLALLFALTSAAHADSDYESGYGYEGDSDTALGFDEYGLRSRRLTDLPSPYPDSSRYEPPAPPPVNVYPQQGGDFYYHDSRTGRSCIGSGGYINCY